jgi:tetratricopeptide (TPR) repeat protein
MSTDAKQPEVQSPSSEDRLIQRSQDFWSKNSKMILIAVGVIVLIVGGAFVYQNYFKQPAEDAANEAIWRAQDNFKKDSFQLALTGNNTKANPGFLKIIKNNGGTKAGNLAKLYAGISYLQLGDFNNAIKFLEEFSAPDKEMKLLAEGALGDAYAETGKFDKAIEKYKSASTINESDEFASAENLYKLGSLYDKTGKAKEAIEAFTSLREKYPTNRYAFEVVKYLGKLGETK